MDSKLYEIIANSIASRSSREENAVFIANNPQYFEDFMAIAINTKDKNHHKALWILELIVIENPWFITPFLEVFCTKLPNFDCESAKRSVSKICMIITQNKMLNNSLEEIIMEACWDWLISEKTKVASRVYAARTLFELGKKYKWIYSQLQTILSDDYEKYSPGYKAAARDILKKMKYIS